MPGTLSVIGKKSGANADRFLDENEEVEFGRHKIVAVETPGHTWVVEPEIFGGCMCVMFVHLKPVLIADFHLALIFKQ